MATVPPPPEGYETISTGYDERLAHRQPEISRRGRPTGYVMAYVRREWRPVSIERRNRRSLDVSYLGPDGNTWTGGRQRVIPECVAVRVGGLS